MKWIWNYSPPQSATNPLLPNEQVLWEGKERKSFSDFGIFVLIQLAAIIGVSFLVQGLGQQQLFLNIMIPFFGVLNIILFFVFLRQKSTHYILTPERLIIKTSGSQPQTINANFFQMLTIELKNQDKNPYVVIISPYLAIPSTYRPARGAREFYQILYPLWQAYWVNTSPTEKVELAHLYNPPMQKWIKFRFVWMITLDTFLILQTITHIPKTSVFLILLPFAWLALCIFVNFKIGGLQSFILGKEYKLSLRVSPLHTRVTLALFGALVLPVLIICEIAPWR